MAPRIRSSIASNGIAYIASGAEHSDCGIIFVHGWCCQATDFIPVLSELSPSDYHAIAVDLPGHGKTAASVCPVPTISSFAELVLDLANELHMSRTVLAGHSMGVRVIMDAWHQQSSRQLVSGIVLIDGSHYKLRPGLFAFDQADKRSAALTDDERAAKFAEAFQHMFSDHTPTSFQASALQHVTAMDPICRATIRKSHLQYDYDVLDSRLDALGKSRLPILNLQSTDVNAQNHRVSLKAGQRTRWMDHLSTHAPQSRQEVVTSSGHFPHIDQPTVVAEKIAEFLNITWAEIQPGQSGSHK